MMRDHPTFYAAVALSVFWLVAHSVTADTLAPASRTAAPFPETQTMSQAPQAQPNSRDITRGAPVPGTPPMSSAPRLPDAREGPVTAIAQPVPGKSGNLAPLSGTAIPAVPELKIPSLMRVDIESRQLVAYWPDARSAELDTRRMMMELGLKRIDLESLGELGGAIAVIFVEGNVDLDELRQRLRKNFSHAVIDYNTRYYAAAGPRHYFADRIGFDASDGPSVPIGIIDGEVARIPALAQARIVSRSFIGKNETPGAAAHATAIAALIAGNVPRSGFSGIARQSPLMNAAIMRQSGKQEHTNTFLLTRALDWLLSQKVRVINLSLGGTGDALMRAIFGKLRTRQVVLVAAAGNSGPQAAASYPAAYPGVLAVTATNAQNEVYASANQGDYIALSAPGEDLWVPSSSGGEYVSGTSFAAAVASATIARLLAHQPDWDSATVRKRLCDQARDLGPVGTDAIFGCGLLQLRATLEAAAIAANSVRRSER